eukprot:gene13276-biopygen6501
MAPRKCGPLETEKHPCSCRIPSSSRSAARTGTNHSGRGPTIAIQETETGQCHFSPHLEAQRHCGWTDANQLAQQSTTMRQNEK